MNTWQEYWMKINSWWNNLGDREKKIVLYGGIFSILAIIYFGIWSPVLDKINTQRDRIQNDEKLLAWMKRTDQEINKLQGTTTNKPKVLSPVALLSDVQNKVKQEKLESHLLQLKQMNNDSISLRLQKIEFDRLIHLLAAILKDQNVAISQLSVISEKKPGIVTSDVVIKLI